MRDFLTFNKMLTPTLIQIIFWLGLGLLVYIATRDMLDLLIARGLEILILGPITLRILCELCIILFKIHQYVHQLCQEKIDTPEAS